VETASGKPPYRSGASVGSCKAAGLVAADFPAQQSGGRNIMPTQNCFNRKNCGVLGAGTTNN